MHWPKAAEQGLRCGVYLARDEVGEVAISNDLGRDVSRAVGGRHKGRRDSLLEESDPIEVVVPQDVRSNDLTPLYLRCFCYYCYYCPVQLLLLLLLYANATATMLLLLLLCDAVSPRMPEEGAEALAPEAHCFARLQ